MLNFDFGFICVFMFLCFQPLDANENTQLQFLDQTTGTNVPKQFVPGIKKGFLDMCQRGQLSGHKVAGVRFRLLDGMHHIVDSSEYAFYLAAQGAVRQAFQEGNWTLLEPIMLVEITGPVEFQVKIF